jgi:SAM-dependent methyltransferase
VSSAGLDTLPPLPLNAWLRWDVVSRMLPRGARSVLEVGCGQGSVGTRLARRYPGYLGLEPDARSAAVAVTRLAEVGRGEVRRCLTSELDPQLRFDIVCAFEVIEHIEDDDAALAEWVGRLAPGGSLLISTPADPERYGPIDTVAGHFRRYVPSELADQLRRAGLVDVRVLRYGAPLGFALERARQLVGKRMKAKAAADHASVEELTAGSGRLLQPSGPAMAWGTRAVTAPFRAAQRHVMPDRGVGLIATGRLPR